MNKKRTLERLVKYNRIGWLALWHRDGWWVGGEKGVMCYGTRRVGKVALTIAWQRDGGRQLKYRLMPFTGADKIVGEHTPKYSALEALQRYEKGKF